MLVMLNNVLQNAEIKERPLKSEATRDIWSVLLSTIHRTGRCSHSLTSGI